MGLSVHIEGTGAVPGGLDRIEMTGGALTIGRLPGNDLVLPDPERIISGRHCVIEERDGEYLLIDISTNGTFLNGAPEPVGQTPAPLRDGDVIAIGRYELRVVVTGAGAPADPLEALLPPAPAAPAIPATTAPPGGIAAADEPGADADDFLDALLGDAPPGPPAVAPAEDTASGLPAELLSDDPLAEPVEDPVPGASLPDHNPAASDQFAPPPPRQPLIPEDWDIEIGVARPRPAGPVPPGPAAPDPFAPPADPAAPDPAAPDPAAPDPAAPGPAAPRGAPAAPAGPAAAGTDAAARAFLRAAGVERLDIPEAELEEVMARLGEAFRILVTGLREVLIARAAIKNEFRLAQTVVSVDGNNPMKFSVSPDHAVEAMARPATPGFMPAPAAAREAIEDIKAHEIAMMSGMQAAIDGLLKRFDPERLQGRIESGGVAGLLGSRKARLWTEFERLYAEIAREAEDDFQTLFGREFARAYQAQIRKL
ncbi:MAG: hypothetical protein KatS3mg118_0551 [Paracoccaceae bacterium]|nr:MAG: hypothetical protein KatS3mg118_0551 [Paracoccaceae bacterium]